VKNNYVAMFLVAFLSSIGPAHCRTLTAEAFLRDKASLITSEKNAETIVDSLMSYEDTTKSVLGETWDTMDVEKRTEFVKLFQRLLRKTISRRLRVINESSVVWSGEEPCHTHVIVHSTVIDHNEATSVDFVMKSPAIGVYKIDDVVILGSSMINTYRSNFRKVVNKSGIDGLLQKLRAKAASE